MLGRFSRLSRDISKIFVYRPVGDLASPSRLLYWTDVVGRAAGSADIISQHLKTRSRMSHTQEVARSLVGTKMVLRLTGLKKRCKEFRNDTNLSQR